MKLFSTENSLDLGTSSTWFMDLRVLVRVRGTEGTDRFGAVETLKGKK